MRGNYYLGQLSEQNDGSWCGLGLCPTAASVVHRQVDGGGDPTVGMSLIPPNCTLDSV